MQASDELKDTLSRVYNAIATGDAAAMEGLTSREEGVRLIGTDPQEWWSGFETITAIWRAQLAEAGGGFALTLGPAEAFVEGSVGWIADQPTLNLADRTLPLRVTGVFRKEGGEWKMAQWHASIGVPNEQAFGQTFTV